MSCRNDDRLRVEGRCYCTECITARAPHDDGVLESLTLTRALLAEGLTLRECRMVRRAAEAEAGRVCDRVYGLGVEQGRREAGRHRQHHGPHVRLLESRPRVDHAHAAAVLEAREWAKPLPAALPECSPGPSARPWWWHWVVGSFVGGCWVGIMWLLIRGWVS